MFAVIKSGGKQYKVAAGDVVKLEKLAGDVGAAIELKDVIAITNDKGQLTLGSPVVSGAVVTGIILEQGKDDKVIIFKKKRRHNYRRKRGHRQTLTWLRIKEIKFGSSSVTYQEPAKKAKPAKKAEGAAKPAAKKESAAGEKKATKKKD